MQHSRAQPALSEEIEKLADFFAEELLKQQEPLYHNPLISFSHYAQKVKAQSRKMMVQAYKNIHDAKEIVKKSFQQSKQYTHLSLWEETASRMKKRLETAEPFENTLQEELGISWEFMDQVYQFGCEFQDSKDYEAAYKVFLFLIFLNPLVVQYWVHEAYALKLLRRYPEALIHYFIALLYNDQDAYVHFEIASCFYHVGDIEESLEFTNNCIRICQEQHITDALYKEASVIQEQLSKEMKKNSRGEEK